VRARQRFPQAGRIRKLRLDELRTLFVPENVVTSLRTKPITVMVVDMSIYPLNTSIAPAPNKVAVTNSTVPFQTR
jgi:hypothetical protein